MKKALLLITAMFLVFGGCKKDVVPEATKVQIEKETIEKGSNYVKISAEYEYPEVLTSVILYLSEKEDMSGALTFKCDIDEKTFRVTADGLKAGTKYHYYYGFSIGYYNEKSEKSEITTLEEEPFETQTITVNGVSFTMIAVEGGTFQMGATSEQGGDAYDNEYPVHSVTLSDYYIGETEVTQELWEAVMGSKPSKFKGSQRPVVQVSWNDCQEFIKKLNQLTGKNFRLPTEAEWEYAARGGNKSQGYKYSGSNTIGNVAWYGDNSNSTHNVKIKSPNELGIYDMSGNVYEWCQDWYGSYSSGSQTNPTGPSSGSYRVYRGGGWSSSAGYCRVSYRYGGNPDFRDYSLGLRLCLPQ